MFSDSERDRLRKLGLMYEVALERSAFNKIAARQQMAEWLAMDRHFDQYDRAALVERVEQCRSNGAKLRLDDERLRNGEPFVTSTGRRY